MNKLIMQCYWSLGKGSFYHKLINIHNHVSGIIGKPNIILQFVQIASTFGRILNWPISVLQTILCNPIRKYVHVQQHELKVKCLVMFLSQGKHIGTHYYTTQYIAVFKDVIITLQLYIGLQQGTVASYRNLLWEDL